jgi:putative hydrolase of the HAD superfamily
MPYDVRGVLFDLDDTLMDHATAAAGAVWRLVRELPGWTADQATTTARWHQLETEHFARYAAGEISMLEQRRARTRAFLDLDGAPDEVLDERFGSYLQHYREGWRAIPGGPELVVSLLDKGYRVGVLTNGQSAQQRAKLATIGLTDPRLVVCVSEDLPAAKPSPLAFAAACEALGLSPNQVLMVGDSQVNDIDGALAAGLQAVHVTSRTAAATAQTGVDSSPAVKRIRVVTDLRL